MDLAPHKGQKLAKARFTRSRSGNSLPRRTHPFIVGGGRLATDCRPPDPTLAWASLTADELLEELELRRSAPLQTACWLAPALASEDLGGVTSESGLGGRSQQRRARCGNSTVRVQTRPHENQDQCDARNMAPFQMRFALHHGHSLGPKISTLPQTRRRNILPSYSIYTSKFAFVQFEHVTKSIFVEKLFSLHHYRIELCGHRKSQLADFFHR